MSREGCVAQLLVCERARPFTHVEALRRAMQAKKASMMMKLRACAIMISFVHFLSSRKPDLCSRVPRCYANVATSSYSVRFKLAYIMPLSTN